MDLKALGWEMFTILCQGTIGGLIVVFATEWLRSRRDKELLRNYITLVRMEVLGHKAAFDLIASRKQLPYDQMHPININNWEQTKVDLADIKQADFELLAAYYQSVEELSLLFTQYHGADWSLFSQPFQQTYYMCKQALCILDKHRIKRPNVLLRSMREFLKALHLNAGESAKSKD